MMKNYMRTMLAAAACAALLGLGGCSATMSAGGAGGGFLKTIDSLTESQGQRDYRAWATDEAKRIEALQVEVLRPAGMGWAHETLQLSVTSERLEVLKRQGQAEKITVSKHFHVALPGDAAAARAPELFAAARAMGSFAARRLEPSKLIASGPDAAVRAQLAQALVDGATAAGKTLEVREVQTAATSVGWVTIDQSTNRVFGASKGEVK